MAEYRLTANESTVIRTADGAFIPDDPMNKDFIEYQQWLEDGGEPDPYVEPETSPPQSTPESEILFDHENRLRVIEGQPPLSMADFAGKQQGP